ncbi:MAG: hypothetical protein AB1898_11920 [Acidobacteriota bacterium]
MKTTGLSRVMNWTSSLITILWICLAAPTFANECPEQVTAQIRLETHHPWRPPFGVERVGQGFTAVAEVQSETRPLREYWLASYSRGNEQERKIVALAGIFSKPPFVGKAVFTQPFDELVLFAKCRFEGSPLEISRLKVDLPDLEAEAMARPEPIVNPVDLGAILVPHDWLLAGSSQKGVIEVAAVSYRDAPIPAKVSAWFESDRKTSTTQNLELGPGKKAKVRLPLPVSTSRAEKDSLHVVLTGEDGRELWSKKIPTMRVTQPPRLPDFGATALKLRYDAPISVRNPETGEFSSMDYGSAWDSSLDDVVVSLPNGSRFAFWRGSSYIPFWAGQHNTGLSYEWAETLPPADGFVDCVEPLMDKELRYSRVEIVESTPARVHVRWRYQSNDFLYKVWGDMPVEDYIFYRDGFGTRTLTLKSAPGATYEVQEFIILAPQSGFPFQVLDPKIADVLFLDGHKQEIRFPAKGEQSVPGGIARPGGGVDPRQVPAVYRVRLHPEDSAAAVSFSPHNTLVPKLFGPFYDRGEMVTPFYWGSHWPLARGNMTGLAIDDRIYLSPSHNSIMTFGMNNHTPALSASIQTHDTLGHARTMDLRRWYWLIGLTDASDQRLLDWAQSFRNPPSLEVKGGRLDLHSYVAERRAMRVVTEQPVLQITITPSVRLINPVFEFVDAPKALAKISLEGRTLQPKEYAWDGATLWVSADIDSPKTLRVEFGSTH